MITAISNFFAMFAAMFSAGAKGCRAIDQLAGIAEDEATGLANVLRVERADRLKKLETSLSIKGNSYTTEE